MLRYVAFHGNERSSLNSVSLIGNLATDVDVKELGDERRVANFVLAVGRAGREGADFVRVAAWNKQAELCERYLAKGLQIGVDGRLRSRTWEDGEGRRQTALEVVANHVDFLSATSRRPTPATTEAAMA